MVRSKVNPLPVAAFTVVWGKNSTEEARTCAASFRHWHPEIPFLCLGESEYRLLSGGNPPAWLGEIYGMRSLAGWFLSRRVKRLIYLDSDIFVLGRLERLLAPEVTAWTSDYSGFTMGVPEAPRINSGALASSDPAFWSTWTAAQYGCLLPAVDRFYFDQLCLRLLVQAGAVRGELIDGRPGSPYYNVAIVDQPGGWQMRNGEVYKGAERALIYHQAGHEKRGVAAAPVPLQAWLEEITREDSGVSPINFAEWWHEDGEAFSAALKEHIARWPTVTLETVLAEAYAHTPGKFRTVSPSAWDRQRSLAGTPWRRIWNPQWQAYLYYEEPGAESPPM
jgi:hypothetical protein